MIRGPKREMETQNKRISSKNVTTENKKRASEEILFLINSLNKIENEKLERAKESSQA